MKKSKLKRLQQLDKRWEQIVGDIDLDLYLSPVNRAQEEKRFLEAWRTGTVVNPVFRYLEPAVPPDREPIERFMQSVRENDPMERFYRDLAQKRLYEIEMISAGSGDVITRHMTALMGQPNPELIAKAQLNLETIPRAQDESGGGGDLMDAEACAAVCRDAMKALGFDYRIVILKDFIAKAGVDHLGKQFIIREDVKFPASIMDSIVYHEIETHILRSVNGRSQPLKIFAHGLPGYMLTEEGLAEYSEQANGCLDPETVRRISARAIGVYTAIRGSFHDVFARVIPYVSEPMAFDIAQRAKLGIRDTSEPGAYTRDYTYLAGLEAVNAFFDDETTDNRKIQAIFCGKIGLNDLDVIAQMIDEGVLNPPRHLPRYIRSLPDIPNG
ncbi:DUF1704 domain-containing protein [bacterium]|nr:DUF1704 domain-containing protein [candidate division CSSED10-310 bacterium]